MQQVHCGRVPQRVWRDVLAVQGRAALFGRRDGSIEPIPHAGTGQRCTARLGKTGASGAELILFIQPRSSLAVFFHNGMTRCLRPFPWRCTAV